MMRRSRLVVAPAAVAAGAAGAAGAPVHYKPGSFNVVPPRYTIEGQLASDRTPYDKVPREMSDRTWRPQKFYFDVNKRYSSFSNTDGPGKREKPQLEYMQRSMEFYSVETKLIWAAFDKPETIPRLLGDYLRLGYQDAFRPEWIEAAIHWTNECRFWRCIGISTPFYDENRLRIHCWENDGLDIGRILLSMPMKEAIMDMERAIKRRDQGLDPNYLWDNWGPIGFIDGRPTDFLPRNLYNPHVDPDGVDVTEDDIAPYVTAESLKERYADFAIPDPTPFEGVFLTPSHSNLSLDDIPNAKVVELYSRVKQAEGNDAGGEPDPEAFRDMMLLCSSPKVAYEGLLEKSEVLANAKSWTEVSAFIESELLEGKSRDEVNWWIDAARLLHNTTRNEGMTERFFEEKCGWRDFMFTPDRQITNGCVALLHCLREVAERDRSELVAAGRQSLCSAKTMLQVEQALGEVEFNAFKLLEDLALDKRRATWANRFSSPANEEKAIDHMMSNFNKRTQSGSMEKNALGESFDREFEPIGRKVQRRVLKSDLQNDEQEKQFKVGSKKGGKRGGNDSSNRDYFAQLDPELFTDGTQ